MTTLREWFDAFPDEAKEDLETFSDYSHWDFDYQVRSMLDYMNGCGNYETPAAPDCESICWTAEHDGDGSTVGWSIGVFIKGAPYHLCEYVDWKETTEDREATGLDQAWAIVEAIHPVVVRAQKFAERFNTNG